MSSYLYATKSHFHFDWLIGALIMLGGFIIHLYEGTAAQPGTFQSMTNGTVTKEWAWTHHPARYAKVTGRNAGEDYERAARRNAAESSERPQDSDG